MSNIKGMLTLLEKLIAFRTISGESVEQMSHFLAEYCENLGFSIQSFADELNPAKINLLCRIGPKNNDGLILSGHMDVVPVEGQPWNSDPFVLKIHDNKAIGRGTADMKGFIACVLQVLKQIDLKRLKKQLLLLWTFDEEIGCKGSAAFVKYAQNNPEFVRQLPKQALIGEPTGLQAMSMHCGHVSMQIHIQGKAAHSSAPDLGESAILAMHVVMEHIQTIANDLMQQKQFEGMLKRPYVTVNIAKISGGNAINIVPDQCTLWLGYRPLPGTVQELVFTMLKERLLNEKRLQKIQLNMEILNVSPALLSDPQTTLAKILSNFSPDKTLQAAGFCTDAGNLAQLGINSYIFGPGSIEVAHKANEFVHIEELERAMGFIEQLIVSQCL